MVPIGAGAVQWVVEPAGFILPPATSRALSFYNIHTGETLRTVYFDKGQYVPGALLEVNYFFRDFRAQRGQANRPSPAGPASIALTVRSTLRSRSI